MKKPNIFLRRRSVLAAAAAAIGLGCGGQAVAQPDLVDFQVVDRDSGKVLSVWRHHGRVYVAGEPGHRYALRVTNHTGGRVLVVMSVDGLNVLTGETAGYDQRGYVFDPYETWDVTGWRKSNREVAQFVFAPLPQSYAARTGRPADVGVIGLAAFREKYVPPPPPPPPPPPAVYDRREEPSGTYGAMPIPVPAPTAGAPMSKAPDAAGSTVNERVVTGSRVAHPGSSSPAPVQVARRDDKLGTGHGAREWSAVRTVDFERATSRPELIRQVEYDTYDNLVAAGVIRVASADHRPRPFPTQRDEQGYVPDPPPER